MVASPKHGASDRTRSHTNRRNAKYVFLSCVIRQNTQPHMWWTMVPMFAMCNRGLHKNLTTCFCLSCALACSLWPMPMVPKYPNVQHINSCPWCMQISALQWFYNQNVAPCWHAPTPKSKFAVFPIGDVWQLAPPPNTTVWHEWPQC